MSPHTRTLQSHTHWTVTCLSDWQASHTVRVIDVVVSIHTELICIFSGIFQNLHDTIGQSDETYGMHGGIGFGGICALEWANYRLHVHMEGTGRVVNVCQYVQVGLVCTQYR